MKEQDLKVGGKYNFTNQLERLIHIGTVYDYSGKWYQFALVSEPDKVWVELSKIDLHMIEETKDEQLAKGPVTTISKMVDKFLCWKLPQDFSPDCGISFDGRKDDELNRNKTWPIGTNLLTATQAKQMFEDCYVESLDEAKYKFLLQLFADLSGITEVEVDSRITKAMELTK